jgi:uncharacterized YigZ family protein
MVFKEKKSKFIGYAFPVRSEAEIKPRLEALRKKHHTANHVCYAWQIGIDQVRYRTNDDGEPANSAGMPIYGQIQSFEVTNTLIAVVRIFGGTKLGVGRLVRAYRTAAQMTLETSDIVEIKITSHFRVQFAYSEMNKVMALIKRLQLEISSQKMEMDCEIIFSADRQNEHNILSQFATLHKVEISKID